MRCNPDEPHLAFLPWSIELEDWTADLTCRHLEFSLPYRALFSWSLRRVTERFERVMTAVPRNLRGNLEPARIFHGVMEHRSFMSERVGSP